ncbi:hypothetical protein JZ751_013703 [Albula glossodonta]|uniref:Chemokine interleukin-8-like domain-containing protein n=1 Tax=Albula glossodonta TaxID=121402 RepID=A0A8T2P4F7_9TELE|nr:hypothetical protein JZ751_013703 [Albula glossodonta]
MAQFNLSTACLLLLLSVSPFTALTESACCTKYTRGSVPMEIVKGFAIQDNRHPIKVNDCCMNVSNRQIQTPITSCKIQAPSHPCVHAVIFTSMGTEYCSSPRARWVRNKIVELKKKGNPCTEWKKRK